MHYSEIMGTDYIHARLNRSKPLVNLLHCGYEAAVDQTWSCHAQAASLFRFFDTLGSARGALWSVNFIISRPWPEGI